MYMLDMSILDSPKYPKVTFLEVPASVIAPFFEGCVFQMQTNQSRAHITLALIIRARCPYAPDLSEISQTSLSWACLPIFDTSVPRKAQ